MTPEQRATDAIHRASAAGAFAPGGIENGIVLHNEIAEVIRAAVAAERERCERLVRYFLVYDSQRAVSWHEVQDCLERIREGNP